MTTALRPASRSAARERAGANKRWWSWVRALAGGAALLFCATQAGLATSLSSAKVGTAALISPTAADTFYGSSTTATNGTGATTRPPEIVELARALKNNPDLIYEYVHNNIEVAWFYGLQKGALGALIDKSGTPFDQAMLMVELLRQSGLTANYVAGTITLTGAQFTAWSNISDAAAACQLLANGGIPAAVNGASTADCNYGTGTAITSVQLAHVWVSVTISGSTYVYDPSYKAHSWSSGIDLAAATGLTAGAPLTQATTGMDSGTTSGVGYVHNLNQEGLTSTLQTYVTNLLGYFQAHNLNAASIEDIIGGGLITPYYAPTAGLRQTTLPYTSSAAHTWSGNIPNQYRTTLGVSGTMQNVSNPSSCSPACPYDTMFNRSFYVDEIYGRRLTVETNFKRDELTVPNDYYTNTVYLRLDGATLATYINSPPSGTTATTRGVRATMSLTAGHPYAVSANGTSTTDGTYMDAATTKFVELITSLTIVHGWGDTGAGLFTKWSEERAEDSAVPRPLHQYLDQNQEPIFSRYLGSTGDFQREKAAANWLAQNTRAAQFHGAIGQSIVQLHHVLGVSYADGTLSPTYSKKIVLPDEALSDSADHLDIDQGFSVTSRAANANDRRAVILSFAASSDALEGSVAAQMADAPDTASTATRFEWGNRPPSPEDPRTLGPRNFLQFTSANASQAASLVKAEDMIAHGDGFSHMGEPVKIDSETTGWTGALSSAISTYAAAGFNIVASQEAFLGPGQRGGSLTTPVGVNAQSGVPVGAYLHAPTKQRGGAFVATLYAGAEPVEIAHIITWQSYSTASFEYAKGGGGGVQPDNQARYNPAEAADVLKSRFVDRSNLLGVDLGAGSLSYSSPAVLKIGNGGFPYELSAAFSWRAGSEPTHTFAPPQPTQPQPGWTTNWQNNLTISGSGLEAMGQRDVRAAAGSIVAFLATQDIYRASPSTSRDVAAVLAQAWWTHQLTGNVATAALGTSTRQFVKVANGQWIMPGAGAYASLSQTGTRAPYEQICEDGVQVPYALSRGWDYSNVSFDVTNANGDVQQFRFWQNHYYDNVNYCGITKGFRLTSWTFPQGPAINIVYAGAISSDNLTETGQLDRIVEVNNSLGRKIEFSGLGGNSPLVASVADGQNPSHMVTAAYGAGNVTASHTDPLGQATSFLYSTPVTVATATQRPVPYPLLTQVFTADNATLPNVKYDYDGLGRVMQVSDAVTLQQGGRAPYQFLIANGTRGERIDPMGAGYAVYFDTKGHSSRYIDELGRLTTAAYDGQSRPVQYVYPEGDQELFAYDDHNNTTQYQRVAKPGCSSNCTITIAATWDQTWNKPTAIVDALGSETDFTYIASGNGVSLMNQAQRPAVNGTRPTYTFTYNAAGQALSSTDPTGLVTQNAYDSSGNLISTAVDPATLNLTTTFGYDGVGNQTSVTDSRGNLTATTFDASRQKLTTIAYVATSTPGTATKWTYDAVGRVIQEARSSAIVSGTITYGSVTQTAYSPTGQKLTVTDPDGRVSTFTYDGDDRVLVATDPVLRRVRKVYDLAGQVSQEIRADNSDLQEVYAEHSYTANGKEAWIKDAKGNQTAYAYDGFDRLSRTTFPDGTYEEATYDANGSALSKRNRAGVTLAYAYDVLNRMATKAMPLSGGGTLTTTWVYDLAGRVGDLSDTNGHDLAYSYDSAKRVISVVRQVPGLTGSLTVAYQYDAASNRTRITWPDGYYVAYGFDALNRMATASENGTYLLATYTYDPMSRRSALVYGNGANTTYTYSLTSDLASLTHTWSNSGGSVGNQFTQTFTKAHQLSNVNASDANYLWQPAAFVTTAYEPANNLNQYTQITPQGQSAQTLGYDATGNLTSDGTWAFGYDAENRLLSAAASGTTATYAYDPMGARTKKTVNGVVTIFLDSDAEEIGDYDGSGNLLRRYVEGPATDQPIAMIGTGASPTRDYFHTDRLGSVVTTTDNNGLRSQGPFTYDAYGQSSQAGGAPFRFTGRRLDPETGLYYYRARYYSAALGRFLQTDPVGYKDQINLYGYVNNDPTDLGDPSGKRTWHQYCQQVAVSVMCAISDWLSGNDGGGDAGNRPPDQLPRQEQGPSGGTQPGGRPPEGRPPQGRPPQGRPPGGRPPEGRPPEGTPPEGTPPGGKPPGGTPPGGTPPGGPGGQGGREGQGDAQPGRPQSGQPGPGQPQPGGAPPEPQQYYPPPLPVKPWWNPTCGWCHR